MLDNPWENRKLEDVKANMSDDPLLDRLSVAVVDPDLFWGVAFPKQRFFKRFRLER